MTCQIRHCKEVTFVKVVGIEMCKRHWHWKCERDEKALDPIKESDDLRGFL